MRLLHRTTRSVSPTQAGEKLLHSIGPKLRSIDLDLELVNNFKDKPAGTVRISAAEHAINHLVWPKLRPLLFEYPDINIELNVNYGFVDIVAERFDVGIRLGENLDQDMIAIPISAPFRMSVVGSPKYFANHSVPKEPSDLMAHNCINIRLPTYNSIYAWEFEKEGKAIEVNVKGQVVFNSSANRLDAALTGLGLAYLPEDMVQPYVQSGELIEVLLDWCPPFDGYYLYYPNRQLSSPAFRLVADALRYN